MKAFDYDMGELHHLREPIAPENQPTIRMNQDTRYSAVVLDLSERAEITLPEIENALHWFEKIAE